MSNDGAGAALGAAATSGAAAGGSGGGQMFEPTSSSGGKYTLRNSFTTTTWGYMWKVDSTGCVTKISSPLAVLPVNQLSTYMSSAQYDLLPIGTTAVSCKIRVTPKGYRCNFQTNASTTTYANTQHTIFGLSAVGLNKSLFGTHQRIAEVDAVEKMKPTKFEKPVSAVWTERMWGTNPNEVKDTGLPMCLGIHRAMPFYYALCQPKFTTKSTSKVGYQHLRRMMKEWDFNAAMGQPIVNYEYQFKNGMLKPREAYIMPIDDVPECVVRRDRGTNNTKLVVDATGTFTWTDEHKENKKQAEFTYNTDIEKPMLRGYTDTPLDEEVQPYVYFGVGPIISSAPFESTKSYTSVQAIWYVEAEITLSNVLDTDFTHSDKLYSWTTQNYGPSAPKKACDNLAMINRTGYYEL